MYKNSMLFNTRSRKFGLYGDITIDVEGLQKVGLYLAPMAFSLGWISHA